MASLASKGGDKASKGGDVAAIIWKFQKSAPRNFQRRLPALSNLCDFWNTDMWAEQHVGTLLLTPQPVNHELYHSGSRL